MQADVCSILVLLGSSGDINIQFLLQVGNAVDRRAKLNKFPGVDGNQLPVFMEDKWLVGAALPSPVSIPRFPFAPGHGVIAVGEQGYEGRRLAVTPSEMSLDCRLEVR